MKLSRYVPLPQIYCGYSLRHQYLKPKEDVSTPESTQKEIYARASKYKQRQTSSREHADMLVHCARYRIRCKPLPASWQPCPGSAMEGVSASYRVRGLSANIVPCGGYRTWIQRCGFWNRYGAKDSPFEHVGVICERVGIYPSDTHAAAIHQRVGCKWVLQYTSARVSSSTLVSALYGRTQCRENCTSYESLLNCEHCTSARNSHTAVNGSLMSVMSASSEIIVAAVGAPMGRRHRRCDF